MDRGKKPLEQVGEWTTVHKKPNKGKQINPNKLQFRDYKTYSLHALLDTGATTSSCRENAIPVEKWN